LDKSSNCRHSPYLKIDATLRHHAEKMFRLADEKYSGKDVTVTKVLSANASFY